MILTLSLGFALGVLAVVFADAVERLRAARRRIVVYAAPFESPRQRQEAVRARIAELIDNAAFQDSTLPKDK